MERLKVDVNWIIENLEQDWDDDDLYYEVTEDGKIKKYNIRTGTIYEYFIVAH